MLGITQLTEDARHQPPPVRRHTQPSILQIFIRENNSLIEWVLKGNKDMEWTRHHLATHKYSSTWLPKYSFTLSGCIYTHTYTHTCIKSGVFEQSTLLVAHKNDGSLLLEKLSDVFIYSYFWASCGCSQWTFHLNNSKLITVKRAKNFIALFWSGHWDSH